jgi:hypothetical protein
MQRTTSVEGRAEVPVETAATAAYPWARHIGGTFRLEARGVSDNAMALLRVAFGDDGPGRARPLDLLRAHDRALGVLVVLSGLSARALEARARREGRTAAFAEAAAWAFSMGDRDPRSFSEACRVFRRIQASWDEGVAAALLGFSDPSQGPVFQRAWRHARRALDRRETWAVVGQLRATSDKAEGYAAAARDDVDDRRFLREPAYRAGALLGLTVRTLAGENVARVEAATLVRRAR